MSSFKNLTGWKKKSEKTWGHLDLKCVDFQFKEVISVLIFNHGITPTKKGGIWTEVGCRVLFAKNVKTSKLTNANLGGINIAS